MDNFDMWFEERKDKFLEEMKDSDTIKRYMKAAYFLGLDDGQEYTYRDIKAVMSAIKRSIEVPVDEKRMEEMWKAYMLDPDPEGDITVGIKKGELNVVTSGSGGRSVYWGANEEAPLSRDEQIKLMENAPERHKETIKRAMEKKDDNN